ncbi:MAG TPA: hypothetical protein VKP14_00965 [Gaiellaceae bacterium]|nr:hypothetical protein [Gaiellaceae bacterium]
MSVVPETVPVNVMFGNCTFFPLTEPTLWVSCTFPTMKSHVPDQVASSERLCAAPGATANTTTATIVSIARTRGWSQCGARPGIRVTPDLRMGVGPYVSRTRALRPR